MVLIFLVVLTLLVSNVKTKRMSVPKMFGLLRIYELYGSNSFIEIMSELGM